MRIPNGSNPQLFLGLPTDDDKSSLTRIVEYVSRSSQLTRREAAIHGMVAVVTMASPVTYLRPAYDDAPPYNLPDLPVLRWMQVASTWIPTTAIFYLAARDFIETRSASIIPTELTDILEGLSPEEVRWRDKFIFTISGLSAIPLTTPLIKYPLIDTGDPRYDTPGGVVLVTVILISNLVAHLRPLQIMLTNPWYGAPIFAARYLRKKWSQRHLSPEQKVEHELKTLAFVQSAQLKAQTVGELMAKKDQLIDECFVRVSKYGIPHYQLQLSSEFKRISSLADGSFIEELLNYQSTQVNSPPTQMYTFFLNVIGQIGGAMVLGESVGYLANAGDELSILFGSKAAGWAAAAIPVWAFGVLMHNVGRLQAMFSVDFLLGFIRGEQNLSWQIKQIAPLFFTVLLPVNLWISYMTTGSANTMIRGDLQDSWGESFTNIYINVLRWGFVGLVIPVMKDLEKFLVSQKIKYFGDGEIKQILVFEEKVNKIASLLPQLRSDLFDELQLERKAPADRSITPSVSSAHFESKPASRKRRSWCEYFCFRSQQPIEEALLDSNINSSGFIQ